jgi:hypothetical protein
MLRSRDETLSILTVKKGIPHGSVKIFAGRDIVKGDLNKGIGIGALGQRNGL